MYRVAKARGMDLVAITDHDEIAGALELLDARPDADDIIVGEEVSCRLPDGDIEVHLGVYGTTESLHRELQPLRRNVFDVTARLREAGVFFSLNHLLHFYRGQIPFGRYLQLLDEVPALEVRNGTMLAGHNTLIEQLARSTSVPPGHARAGWGAVAGSDAHTLRRVGTTWTEAPGRTRDEFLHSLRHGLGVAGGAHGTTATIAGDAYGVVARYVAALVGFGPQDLPAWRRTACLTFAAVTLPFQFIPFLIAANGKRREQRQVAQAMAHVRSAAEIAPSAPAIALEPQL